MTFTHLDLFAGIGGFSRAVHWLGGEPVAFVEWKAWNRRTLYKHWPHARFFGDIEDVTTDDLDGLGRIDLITGGYPCQPFSVAGKRLGSDDTRHLWPEMRRCINAARPRYVLAENVDGHVTQGLDDVLDDLEADGYAAGAVVVPASGTSALHRRYRVWIMAADADSGQRDDALDAIRAGRDAAECLRTEASLSDTDSGRCPQRDTQERQLPVADGCRDGQPSAVAHAESEGLQPGRIRGGATEGYAFTADRSEGATMADSASHLRRASGDDRREPPDRSGHRVDDRSPLAYAECRGRRQPGRADAERESLPAAERQEGASRDRSGGGDVGWREEQGQAPRSMGFGVDGISAGLVRRPPARPSRWPGWDDPDVIRQMWLDGTWELDLPRLVVEEEDRKEKIEAAGNAIVPIVAYEILRVMLRSEADCA